MPGLERYMDEFTSLGCFFLWDHRSTLGRTILYRAIITSRYFSFLQILHITDVPAPSCLPALPLQQYCTVVCAVCAGFCSTYQSVRTIEVMYISVRQSQHALFALGFFVTMVLTVFSTLLYFAERGTWDDILETFINTDGDPSQFASIPAAAWFVIVTITTVGYGEITPRSFLGRLVTLPLLVFGLLLIALPSFVLGREFSLVWERMAHDSPHSEPQSPTSPFTRRDRGFFPSSRSQPPPSDLSNRKLAHNQTELSKQIAELRGVVEAQGQLITRLVSVLEGKGKARAQDVEYS